MSYRIWSMLYYILRLKYIHHTMFHYICVVCWSMLSCVFHWWSHIKHGQRQGHPLHPPSLFYFLLKLFNKYFCALASLHKILVHEMKWQSAGNGINLLVRLPFQITKSADSFLACSQPRAEHLCKKLSKVTNFPKLVKSNIISSAWSSTHYHERLTFTTHITQYNR